MDGKDVVAMARTGTAFCTFCCSSLFSYAIVGSGKTAAFLVPMFEHLKMHSAKVSVCVFASFTQH